MVQWMRTMPAEPHRAVTHTSTMSLSHQQSAAALLEADISPEDDTDPPTAEGHEINRYCSIRSLIQL
jgi:hypothetical protein